MLCLERQYQAREGVGGGGGCGGGGGGGDRKVVLHGVRVQRTGIMDLGAGHGTGMATQRILQTPKEHHEHLVFPFNLYV